METNEQIQELRDRVNQIEKSIHYIHHISQAILLRLEGLYNTELLEGTQFKNPSSWERTFKDGQSDLRTFIKRTNP